MEKNIPEKSTGGHEREDSKNGKCLKNWFSSLNIGRASLCACMEWTATFCG